MATLRLLLLGLTLLIGGCASAVILHPIETQDIFIVKAGQTVTAPKDGYFLSNLYMEEVAKAKVR